MLPAFLISERTNKNMKNIDKLAEMSGRDLNWMFEEAFAKAMAEYEEPSEEFEEWKELFLDQEDIYQPILDFIEESIDLVLSGNILSAEEMKENFEAYTTEDEIFSLVLLKEKEFEDLTEEDILLLMSSDEFDRDLADECFDWDSYLDELEDYAKNKLPAWSDFNPDRPWEPYEYGLRVFGYDVVIGRVDPEETEREWNRGVRWEY